MKTALAVILFAVSAIAQDTKSRSPYTFQTTDGRFIIAIDTSAAPELDDWAEQKLAPVLAVWYPKIVALLPSTGFTAPQPIPSSFKKWTAWPMPLAQRWSSAKNGFKTK